MFTVTLTIGTAQRPLTFTIAKLARPNGYARIAVFFAIKTMKLLYSLKTTNLTGLVVIA